MANTLLTPTMVTRKALTILHQKLNFVGTINRAYDDSFANDGAKIGNSLKIRLPNQYVTRTGATIQTQDTPETSTTLTVNTQAGVDVNFTSNELTLSLDDFSDRILDPAMSVLAANIEADAMNMVKDVYQLEAGDGGSGTSAAAIAFKGVMRARKRLNDALAPNDGKRTVNLCTQDEVVLVDALKGLFQDSASLSKQYKEGMMGHTAGFDFYENSLWPQFTRGAGASYVCNTSTGITSGTATITVSGGSGALNVGDVFTIVGVNAVHPESKADTGNLQQFVVTAAATSGATSISVSPTPTTSGAAQNIVINSAGASKSLVFFGTASTAFPQSLAYHKNAFTFATADLIMPKGVHFAAREVLDGISMRIVQQYDITNDKLPCRIDVLYGYKTIRPQLACRLATA